MKRTRKFLKRLKRIVRRPFEWLGIGLAVALITPMPRCILLAMCDFAAWCGYHIDRGGRRMAKANLAIIYGRELPVRTREMIIRRCYRNMARTLAHVFWTFWRGRARVTAAGELSPEAVQCLDATRPLITVSGHLGCWEILSQLVQMHGIPIMSVAKDIGSGGMTRLLMRSRRAIGQQIIPAEGAFLPLLQMLKAGNDIGLLVDQVVRPKDGGVWVRYFGRPVCVSAAPAFLGAKAKAAIAVAWSRPLKDGRYRCEVVRVFPHTGGKADIWGMTQDVTASLERIIRRHPDCWTLTYNIFRKHPKPEEAAQLEEREAKRR
ncbi:MAG: hypothetical protein IJ802_00005 [Kiritimatiellae bacterium]|nr:hypothetical protein [Kiritimatiellia bacterium]